MGDCRRIIPAAEAEKRKLSKKLLSEYPNIKIHICTKAYRSTILTDDGINNKSPHHHARIGHIFSYMTGFMSKITAKARGLKEY